VPPGVPAPLPATVEIGLDDTVRDYWLLRARQHLQDSYAGVPLLKFPEDLRVYEHLLWQAAPEVVIELGARFGGSALWFRDRLRALRSWGRIETLRVISVDLDIELARAHLTAVDPGLEDLVLLSGDLLDPELPARVAEHLPPGAPCLVIEDSAHVYETTLAALEGFTDFIPPGGYFVVEDGCVDVEELRLPEWPRGVLPALADWLASPAGREFEVRRDLELYGISCHPGGFLQRRAQA